MECHKKFFIHLYCDIFQKKHIELGSVSFIENYMNISLLLPTIILDTFLKVFSSWFNRYNYVDLAQHEQYSYISMWNIVYGDCKSSMLPLPRKHNKTSF